MERQKYGSSKAFSLDSYSLKRISETDLKACKICLIMGKVIENQKLISPCRCHGSLGHVHKECLSQWLNLKLNKKEKKKKSVLCEICRIPIQFETSKVIELKNCEEVTHSIKQNFIPFALTIFTFALIVGLIMAVSILMGMEVISEKSEYYYFAFVIFIGGALLIIILSIYLIHRFLLKADFCITEIKEGREGVGRKDNGSLDRIDLKL